MDRLCMFGSFHRSYHHSHLIKFLIDDNHCLFFQGNFFRISENKYFNRQINQNLQIEKRNELTLYLNELNTVDLDKGKE
ncbi:hypothetical protein BpHYR1_049452 [Brachionus plicatilis]|uniref:Uncharacterized protein n=1 Tax=Brachionus plicatilis TaxID=10195 RepID=A0A3M7SB29_BRAPC|nr:hypothetical protein BpHYR1_049452 [Brachionus plicatilis]